MEQWSSRSGQFLGTGKRVVGLIGDEPKFFEPVSIRCKCGHSWNVVDEANSVNHQNGLLMVECSKCLAVEAISRAICVPRPR